MQVAQVLIFTAAIFFSRSIFKDRLYKWVLFVMCLFSIYWFQPASPIRNLDFWLPSMTLFLAVTSWGFINRNAPIDRDSYYALAVILFFLLIIAVVGFLKINAFQSIISSPGFIAVSIFALIAGTAFVVLNRSSVFPRITYYTIIAAILLFLVILKSDYLASLTSRMFRSINGQLTTLASSSEISWIGYSYFAFRLLHTLIDHQRVKDLKLSLREYFTYLVFFPAFIAGPIDRVEHFSPQLKEQLSGFHERDILVGVERIARGIFLKFILADSLALFSLNYQSVGLIKSAFWTWVIVYGFAFRIFLDFAGYTDIAIGLGRMAGIHLPENFNNPYSSKNVTLFWNSWHITLTQWFRTYYFNPVTRFFRSRFVNIPPWLIILVTQMTTMVLIGLWHGISWNFVIWGAWNGAGLFFHNRWSSVIIPKLKNFRQTLDSRIVRALSVVFTINFIALGWIWFALPTPAQSIAIFSNLLGF